MQLIKKNDFASFNYDETTKMCFMKFSGTVNINKGLEILEEVMKFSESNTILLALSDLSELKGTFTMLNEYLEKTFFPKVISNGLIANGLVVSKDVFTQFAVQDLMKRIGNFELQTFSSLKEAEKWLLEKSQELEGAL